MSAGLDITAQAVLLDMDGTLVDSTAVVELVWADFARTYGLDVRAVLSYAHGRQSIDSVRHFLPEGLDAIAVTRDLDAQELERVDGIVEVPGAARFLASLDGARVAVVTSASRELATRRMQAAGLAPPRVIVAAEDISEGKPSPAGYLRAADLLGVAARQCVILEDAEAGLVAAVASGSQVLVVGGHRSLTTAGLPRIADLTGLRVTTQQGSVRLRHP